jgi:hypothetical protein
LCTFSTNTFLASLLVPRHEKQIFASVKAQNVVHVLGRYLLRSAHTCIISNFSLFAYLLLSSSDILERSTSISGELSQGIGVCVCVCVCTCVICSIQYIEISIYLSSIYICELIRRQVASRRHDRCTDILRNRCDLNHVIIRRTPHIYMSKDSAGMPHAVEARLERSDAAGERLQVYIDTIRR